MATEPTDPRDRILIGRSGETLASMQGGQLVINPGMTQSAPSTDQPTTLGVGAKNGATVSVAESGNGAFHKTVLTLTATPVTLTDEAGVGQAGGVKLYDLPAGNILILGAVLDVILTLVGAPWVDTAEGDIGLGTAAALGADALATTEQNIIPTTEIAALVAQVGPAQAQSTGVLALALAGGTDADVILNVRIDDNAAHVTATGTMTGTVTLTWVNLGDF